MRRVRKDKISVTNATAKAIAAEERNTKNCTPKARAISKAIEEGEFGCRKQSVFTLVSTIVDFPLPPITNEKNPAIGSMTICTGANYNGHNYGNKPFIVINERNGIMKNKEVGNNFPINPGSWRYATKKEINWYYAK